MSLESAFSRPLRVCVVGAGSISREFALYHFGPSTNTVVTSIVDIDEERARRLAADVGSVQAGAAIEGKRSAYSATAAEVRGTPVQSATELGPCLQGCDVVYVGTPPNSHASLVLEALKAGKSILLEKPLAAKPVTHTLSRHSVLGACLGP
jgi:predicted dehydrogenase